MPFLFLCIFALAAGLVVELCAWRLTAPAHDRARGVGEVLARHGSLRAMLDARGVDTVLLHYAQLNPLSSPFWNRMGYRPLWTGWEVRPAASLR